MLSEVMRPAAIAPKIAEMKRTRKERFESVSLSSRAVRRELKGRFSGGCFRNGMCRCVPIADTRMASTMTQEATREFRVIR